MDDEQQSRDGNDGRFNSFAELQRANTELMHASQSQRKAAASEGGSRPAVRAFVAKAQATGAILQKDAERQAAQNILDYWSAEVVSAADIDEKSWTPAMLAPFQPETLADASGGSAPSDVEVVEKRQASREQIRLAAVARQWLNSERAPGYLLTGRALTEAARYRDADRDIGALISASETAAALDIRHYRIRVSVIIAVLLAAAVALLALWLDADEKRKIAEQAIQFKDAASDADAQRLEQERQKAVAAAEDAQRRLVDLQRSQRQLDVALIVIRRAIEQGKLGRSDLPEELLPALDVATVAPATAFPNPSDPSLSGYDPGFLGGITIAPQLSADLTRTAFESGRRLNYVNYSVVLSSARRMAILTASNLDRQRLRVLPRVEDRFALDPRVPVAAQPDPAWFRNNDLDLGHLVTRQEIAWGPYFEGDVEPAAHKLAGIINVYPNVTPQFDTFNRGVWTRLERWVQVEHNKGASRISIFSGPVLRDNDPVISGARVPRQFWKIAVSHGPDGAGLVVDAFLIPQFRGDSQEKISQATPFNPQTFRVKINDIERLTGLDFGAAVRDASDSQTEGDRLAAVVGKLDAPTAAERTATAQQIINVVRDQTLPEPEQRKVVAALVNMARDDSMRNLNTTGRYNLLYVLSEIPKSSWDRPAWIDLKAGARRAVADLEKRVAGDEIQAGPDTQRWLTTLKERLSWAIASSFTVLLQFAGTARENAVRVSTGLKALGWKIPGEERTSAAAGENEVRFGAAGDLAAAELLAADVRALGWSTVRSAKRNPSIKPGTIEIWISQ